jgi:small subunit ribosomal protein S11
MAQQPSQKNAAAARARKKVKKSVSEGIAHIHASFNNTIITITDRQGKRRLPPSRRDVPHRNTA